MLRLQLKESRERPISYLTLDNKKRSPFLEVGESIHRQEPDQHLVLFRDP